MNYGEIKKTDIANGFGVRVSLFVSGCSHRCQDCFNSETWDFSYGQPFTAQTEEELLEALAPGFVNGLTLLGGDPFEISNQRALLPFLRRVKKAFPGKDIWCYTGAVLDRDLIPDGHYFCEATEEMLSLLVLADESLRKHIIMLCLCVTSVDEKISFAERRYIRKLCDV